VPRTADTHRTSPRHHSRLLGILALIVLARCPSVTAEDLIHIQRDGFNEAMTVKGEVLDYTGRIIRYRSSGTLREDLAARVHDIETHHPEAFTRGRQAFDQGQYDAARQEWTSALKDESRDWVRREIRTWLIRCAWRQDNWPAAGEQFLEIINSDPHSPHWSVAPLVWTPQPISEQDRTAARTWLAAKAPQARLLGASLLLTDATLGESAAKALDELAREVAPNVAELARCQLWRRRGAVAISDTELAGWRNTIDDLPATLRSGPQYLYARARLARSEFDLAAAEFLWVSTIYIEHEPTAARATLDTAVSLKRAGRSEDAAHIYRETIERFAWSTEAIEAKSRLTELENPATSNP
jgi:TolA-binding protein